VQAIPIAFKPFDPAVMKTLDVVPSALAA